MKITDYMSPSSEAIEVSPETIKQQIERLEIQIDEIDELLAVDPNNHELISLRDELDEKINSIEKALGGAGIDLNLQSEGYVHVTAPDTIRETLETRARQSPLIANEKAVYLSACSDLKAGLYDKTNRVTYDLDPGNPNALDAIIADMQGRTSDFLRKTRLPAESIDNPREAIHGKHNNSQLNIQTVNEKLLVIEQKLDEKLTGLEKKLDNMSGLEKKLDRVLGLLGSFPSNKEPDPRTPYGAAASFLPGPTQSAVQKPAAEHASFQPDQSRCSTRFSADKHWGSTKHTLATSVEPAENVDQGEPAKITTRQPVLMNAYEYDNALIAELRAAHPQQPMSFRESEEYHQKMNRLQALNGSSSNFSLLLANLKNDGPIYPAPTIAPNSQTRKPDSTSKTALESAAIGVPEKNRFVADVKFPIHAKEQKIVNILNRMETLNFHELPDHVVCDKERNAISSVVDAVTGIPNPKVPTSTNTQKLVQKNMGEPQNIKDIDLVVQQTRCSRHEAIIALQKEYGCVIGACWRLSI
ncbi:Ubiquitin carboxyl-terminal hydrolase 14 [Venturia nashicola]|uniref:Ubiquitin carboxyl-terminal hydrolase 14 n=1 Tax=Venturia nashicola TaxID=86259 RepID=A0A4Z1PXS8_9PEZI|nr:Ubiquitin carboxyl-terminal hydrolase 14 [Venturia nashicola]